MNSQSELERVTNLLLDISSMLMVSGVNTNHVNLSIAISLQL